MTPAAKPAKWPIVLGWSAVIAVAFVLAPTNLKFVAALALVVAANVHLRVRDLTFEETVRKIAPKEPSATRPQPQDE